MTLADLGIAAEAERLYRLVLRVPGRSADELAAAAGASAAQVRCGLEQLATLGLLRERPDPAGPAWVAVDPALAIDDLIERLQDDLVARQHRVVRARAAVTALVHERDAGRATVQESEVRRIEGLSEVRVFLEELAFYTRDAVWSVLPDGVQHPEALAASQPLDLRALRRGVDMRTLYDPAVLTDEGNVAYIRDMASRGAASRTAPDLPERLILVDRTTAVIPVEPTDSSRGALVVTQPSLVLGFVQLFERLWADAVTVEPSAQEADELTDVERELLRLLCRGVKDEAAARQLGISVRTLRRHIADLSQRLGAASRFQAGVLALQRGWL